MDPSGSAACGGLRTLASLPPERLDVYQLSRSIARWVRATSFPTGDHALEDQARRAADSVLLNLTEGCYQIGKNRQKHFRIAMGSAAEVLAVLDLVDLPEGPARQEDCRRVVMMLHKLR